MKRSIVILVSALGALAIASVAVWLGWLLQIEGRAYQCDDTVWPVAWFSTDMTSHRQAGDTLSPSWTWEEIEGIGRAYRAAFILMWVGIAALSSTVWMKKRKQNNTSEHIP